MNQNQMSGSLKETFGKLQTFVGEILGSKVQQEKGIRQQLGGKVQKVFGNTQETFRGAINSNKNLRTSDSQFF